MSTDGGRTFGPTGGRMFGDHHALWIDPTNPKRLLSGTDGGFFISNDYGRNWDFVNNMPMAQAYHLGVDMAEPYNVMGGFQDHEIWRGPNEKWNQVGVREGDWLRLRYMADGMHTIADPRDPNIIYYNGHFGDITRLDMRNREERYIQPYPPGPIGGGAMHDQYRFNWNSPVHMSPTNPDVALLRRQRAVQDDRPRRALVDHQPRSDHQRQVETGGRAAARSRTTTREPSSTARSSRLPRARAMPTSSGRGPTMATCRSRATAARRGPTSRRTSPARRSSPGSRRSPRPRPMRGRRTFRSISTASTTSRRTCSSRPTTARRGGGSPTASRATSTW